MRSIDVHAHLTPQCFWHATTEKGGDWHMDNLTQAEMEAILWRNLERLLGLTG